MTRIYFDVSDIVYFAARYSRVTGIQRVQLNVIDLLARKYGGAVIRCAYFDDAKKATFEFDPAERTDIGEFDADQFLRDIGMSKPSARFPGKAQVKSYLRYYNNRKWLRVLKKIDIYISALLWPRRLQKLGLAVKSNRQPPQAALRTTKIDRLPDGACYLCMGSTWLHPKVWEFAQSHRDRGGSVVQLVYDLIPIVHPEYYAPKEPAAYKAWLDAAFRYADRFIGISKWTVRDLREYAKGRGFDPEVTAIPLAHEFTGFDRISRVEPSPLLVELAKTRFVLCIGTIEHRKNALILLKVWHQLHSERSPDIPTLVFAGKFGKGSDRFQALLAADEALAKLVIVLNSPSDKEVAWLYQNCLFTVFPSTYEGWGLPVGEAAWFGKYCVASNGTSIPEVCGDLIEYVDPNSVDDIKSAILKLLADRAFLQNRESQIAGSRLRKWSDVAEDICGFAQRATV